MTASGVRADEHQRHAAEKTASGMRRLKAERSERRANESTALEIDSVGASG